MQTQEQVVSIENFRATKSQEERVSEYISENNIDLSDRFKPGAYEIIGNTVGLSAKQAKSAIRKIRVAQGLQTEYGVNSEKIRDCVDDLGIDITKRLTGGTRQTIAELTDSTLQQVTNAIATLRRHSKHKVYQRRETPKHKIQVFPNTLVDYCVENNLVRANPGAERAACDNMCKIMMDDLPRGGVVLIIGTPTPFCASSHDRHNLLLTDNLKVAHVADLTSDEDTPPFIVIGNAIDPDKAELKAFHWANNNTTNHCPIETGIVDKISYTHYVTKLAEKYDVCKVILMGSGVWNGSMYSEHKWKGFDFDFRSPSEYLITRYKNLHIVAMTIGGDKGNFHYVIEHLHYGMEEKETV